jgi:hypothetical protein
MESKESVKNLRPNYSKWKHAPTASRRFPELFIEQLGAIAHWVDEQEDPEEAIASILEFIKDKG